MNTTHKLKLNQSLSPSFWQQLRNVTCAMATTSGDQGDGEAGVDVVDAGDLLRRRLRAAPLLIGGFVVINY